MAKNIVRETPIGTAFFPNLIKPEVFDGNEIGYTVKLALTDAEIEAKEEEFREIIREAIQSDDRFKNVRNKANLEFRLPVSVLKDGTKVLKFKSKATITNNGEIIKRKPPVIVDAKCNPLPEGVEVPHRSKIRIRYIANPYNSPMAGVGISLLISEVQVAEFANERAGRASSFTELEGYEGYSQPELQEENPDAVVSGFDAVISEPF